MIKLKQGRVELQKSMIKLLSIADFISLTNALFGFFSILVLFSSFIDDINLKIHISFSLILLGLLADGLDGIVARKFGKSGIGEYLEAMADMTTLVIAPAVFVYFIYSDLVSVSIYRNIYLLFALLLFVFFGFVRLASFGIMKEKKLFIGLPASASTIIILNLSYLKVDFILILPLVVIIGAAMASTIEFLKPNKYVNIFASILIFLCILLEKNFYSVAPILLLTAILIYSVGGPIYKFLIAKK